MLAKGDKRFLYCVAYLDKRSWKREYFCDFTEASNFCFSLRRSPDLIRSVEFYAIGFTVDFVNREYRFEV